MPCVSFLTVCWCHHLYFHLYLFSNLVVGGQFELACALWGPVWGLGELPGCKTVGIQTNLCPLKIFEKILLGQIEARIGLIRLF